MALFFTVEEWLFFSSIPFWVLLLFDHQHFEFFHLFFILCFKDLLFPLLYIHVECYCMTYSNMFLSFPGEISLLICLLYHFKSFGSYVSDVFFLVSELTKVFAKGNDLRKWNWGNWVGKGWGLNAKWVALTVSCRGWSQGWVLSGAVKKWKNINANAIASLTPGCRQYSLLWTIFYLIWEYFMYLHHPQIRFVSTRTRTVLSPWTQMEDPGAGSSSMYVLH